MGLDENRRTIEAFAAACRDEPLILAAFLGGSMASGTADERSDLDLYVITPDEAYDEFYRKRGTFVRRWGDPALLHDIVNFEGLGFDMVLFVFGDGVEGELALGRRSTFLSMHGGPYKVLADKAGLLEGVEFPLKQPSPAERAAAVQSDLGLFWRECLKLVKYLRRDNLWAAQDSLNNLRQRCRSIRRHSREPIDEALLRRSYVLFDRGAILGAGLGLVEFCRRVGPSVAGQLGIAYPAAIEQVAVRRIEQAFAVSIPAPESAGRRE